MEVLLGVGFYAEAAPSVRKEGHKSADFTIGQVVAIKTSTGTTRFVVTTAHSLFGIHDGKQYVRGKITDRTGLQLNDGEGFSNMPYQAQLEDHVDFGMFHISDNIEIIPFNVSDVKKDLLIRAAFDPGNKVKTAVQALGALGTPSQVLEPAADGALKYYVFKFGERSGWTAGELVARTQLGYYVVKNSLGFEDISGQGDCGSLWFVCDGAEARLLGYHVARLRGDDLQKTVEAGMAVIAPWQSIETEAKAIKPETQSVAFIPSAIWKSV